MLVGKTTLPAFPVAKNHEVEELEHPYKNPHQASESFLPVLTPFCLYHPKNNHILR